MKHLTDQINKIREEIAPKVKPTDVSQKLIDRLTDLISMNESTDGTRPNLSSAIISIGNHIVPQIEDKEAKEELDNAMVDLLDTVIGVDPDDDDDSIPPIECAFYGPEWDELNKL